MLTTKLKQTIQPYKGDGSNVVQPGIITLRVKPGREGRCYIATLTYGTENVLPGHILFDRDGESSLTEQREVEREGQSKGQNQ